MSGPTSSPTAVDRRLAEMQRFQGDRLMRERLPHDGIELLFDGVGHRIDIHALTGLRMAIYAQSEIARIS